jgi:WD40 repeat protein
MELVYQAYTKWALPPGAISRIGKGQINDVKFSSDGKLLVVASSIGIWIYDADTGKEVDLIAEHTGSVNVVAFSPDSRTFASGGRDAMIHLWDIKTKSLLSTLRGHTASVDTLVFSPDGTILASASQVMTDKVRLWDVDNASEHTISLGYWSSASTLAFSPNGNTLAIGEGNGGIHLYDTHTGSACPPYLGRHGNGVNTISYSPDGKLFASGSSDNTILLRDAKTGKRNAILTKHTHSVVSLLFSPDGEILASGGLDGMLRLWEAKTGKELFSLIGHSGWINALAYSNDGRTLVSGGNDGTLRFWNVVTRQEKLTVTGHTSEAIGPIVFSPDGSFLASQTLFQDETIKLLNVNTGQESCLSLERPAGSKGLAFSAGSNILASGSFGEIHFWNAKTGAYISTLGNRKKSGTTQKFVTKVLKMPPLDGHTDWVSALAFSQNNQFLASGSADKTIRLWSLSASVEMCSPGRHEDWISTLSFSSDSYLLASGSKDGKIKIWDIWNLFTHVNTDKGVLKPNMNREVSILGKHEDGVSALSFSSDSRILAIGGEDGTIQLWDVNSNLSLSTLIGHTGWVYTLTFLCDDSILVSGAGKDNTIRFWNTSTGQELSVISGHTSPVRTLAFLSDSRILASAGNDGTIFLWDWDRIAPQIT